MTDVISLIGFGILAAQLKVSFLSYFLFPLRRTLTKLLNMPGRHFSWGRHGDGWTHQKEAACSTSWLTLWRETSGYLR